MLPVAGDTLAEARFVERWVFTGVCLRLFMLNNGLTELLLHTTHPFSAAGSGLSRN